MLLKDVRGKDKNFFAILFDKPALLYHRLGQAKRLHFGVDFRRYFLYSVVVLVWCGGDGGRGGLVVV
jgi:hypothetical protein